MMAAYIARSFSACSMLESNDVGDALAIKTPFTSLVSVWPCGQFRHHRRKMSTLLFRPIRSQMMLPETAECELNWRNEIEHATDIGAVRDVRAAAATKSGDKASAKESDDKRDDRSSTKISDSYRKPLARSAWLCLPSAPRIESLQP
jgi:hypothetical protein